MSGEYRHLGKYIQGEEWVLGGPLPTADPEKLALAVRALYVRDFINWWSTQLERVAVPINMDPNAALRLAKQMPGVRSLMQTTAAQSDVDDPEIRKAFDWIQTLVQSPSW